MKDQGITPRYLTLEEAGIYLSTSPQTLWKWCRAGILPHIKIGSFEPRAGRKRVRPSYRIDKEVLDRFLKNTQDRI